LREQILKLDDGSKMVRITNDQIVQLIKEKFKGTPFEVIHERKDEGSVYILQSAMMIMCVEKSGLVKISFHVAVRCDIAYRIIMELREIVEIKDVEVTNVFYYDERESKLYYGVEAEQKMLADLRVAVLNEFMHEQTELMMLRNMRSPYVC
jgi:hypothetical protein